MKRIKRSKKSVNAYILLLIITFAASMGASYLFLKEKFSFNSAFINEIESRQADAVRKGQKKDTPRLYGSQGAVSAEGDESKDNALVSAEDAARKYIQSYSARLLDLYMDGKGVVYINLGDGLKKNFHGDALEELSFFAGLYRSLEAVVPDFTALKVLIEGHEVETIGGHLDISKPLGKEIAENI